MRKCWSGPISSSSSSSRRLLFTVLLFALSYVMNAPLLDEANANVTNDPAKAPWYLLNLQELLLHMNPALAGIVVPTVWLIILGAFPYFDQSTEGQGRWFADANSVKNTVVSFMVGWWGTLALILWNSGKVALWLKDWFGFSGGDTLAFLERSAALKDPSVVPWPGWADSIPYLWFNLKLLDEGPGAGVTTFQNSRPPDAAGGHRHSHGVHGRVLVPAHLQFLEDRVGSHPPGRDDHADERIRGCVPDADHHRHGLPRPRPGPDLAMGPAHPRRHPGAGVASGWRRRNG